MRVNQNGESGMKIAVTKQTSRKEWMLTKEQERMSTETMNRAKEAKRKAKISCFFVRSGRTYRIDYCGAAYFTAHDEDEGDEIQVDYGAVDESKDGFLRLVETK